MERRSTATAAVLLVLVGLTVCHSVTSDGGRMGEAVSDGEEVLTPRYSAVIAAYAAAKESGACTEGILVEVANKHQWDSLPQTPPRLLQVMHQEGYTEEELQQVARCLIRSWEWFGHAARSSSRTYAAHCIGTGGALVLAHKPAAQVCAAVLHSIYAFGEPSHTRCNLAPQSRVESDCEDVERFQKERLAVALDRYVGAEVEQLITFYQLFPTSGMDSSDVMYTLRAFKRDGREFFGELGAWSVAMHVANELDEYVHWDAVIGPNRRRDYRTMAEFLELAEAFGEHKLAEGLYYSYSQFLAAEHLMSKIRMIGLRTPHVKGFPRLERFEALTAVDGRLCPPELSARRSRQASTARGSDAINV